VFSAFSYTCRSRKLFITEKGHVGLGPRGLQVGDLAVVCLGGKLPYILREQVEKGKCYLIGEPYVHGMIKGEALDMIELRDFTLI